jgi:hypothetical protein
MRSLLLDCADKAVDSVVAEQASERSLARQVMQMGKRLAQRERHLVPVEGPPEQHREQLRRALGASARRNDLRATRPVMCREIVDPRCKPKKGRLCEGRTSASAGTAPRNLSSECKKRDSGSPSGS